MALADTGARAYSWAVLHPKRPRALATFVLTVTLVLLVCPHVSAGPATDRLRDFFVAVNAVLADPAVQERPREAVPRIRRLVADLSDVGASTAAALGHEWQARTRAEQEELTDLFAEFLERAYVGRLGGTARLTGGVVVAYLHELLADDEAMVATALRAKDGRDVAVEYHMANHHGRWLVRDIVLDGVSTVKNYRAQFMRLLRQGAYAELVSRLRAKLTEESLIFARAEPRVRAAKPAAPAVLETAKAAPLEQVEPASVPKPVAAIAGVPPVSLPAASQAPRPAAAAAPALPASEAPASRAPSPAAPRAVSPPPPMPAAASAVPPMTAEPEAVESASPAAMLPSRARADSASLLPLALLPLALVLSLVGARGAAYFRKRTPVGGILTGWQPPAR